MNLLEEYILRKKNIIILISGLSGTKRSIIAKEIERDFKLLKLISLDDYCDVNKVKTVDFFDNKVNDWDNIEVYDWEKFNKDIDKKKNYIIYGDIFPKDKLNFEPNFHIHITISKEKLIEKRREYIENNPEKCKDMLNIIDKLNTFINQITYSHYIKNRNNSKIDLWLKSEENTQEQMGDQIFEFIINKMTQFLNEYYISNKRNFDYIKEKENINPSSSEDESDDSTTDNDESDDSTTENDINEVEDEVDKVYNEENKNNISLARFTDYKQELMLYP